MGGEDEGEVGKLLGFGLGSRVCLVLPKFVAWATEPKV